MPQSARSSSSETSTRAETEVTTLDENQFNTTTGQTLEAVDVSVVEEWTHKPSLSKAKRFNLNPKAPAFAPSQTWLNEDSHCFADTGRLSFDPAEPVFVVPSTILMNDQADKFSRPPCDLQAPPGLEGCFASSPWQLPAPAKGAKHSKGKQPDIRQHGDTMKFQLEALQLEDPAAVFIARGINKLGFSSVKTLKAHFSRYGQVKTIYAPPSRVKSMHRYGEGKQAGEAAAHWRLRAPPLAFIVMKTSEATDRILADGPEQNVNGTIVRLQTFQHHACVKDIPGADADEAEKS